VDAAAELPHRDERLPAHVHRLRPALPHGRHPAAQSRGAPGPGVVRGPRPGAHRHRVRRPRRCLPWAMDTPCIVCQENCPVSPKAIFTREVFTPVRATAPATVARAEGSRIVLQGDTLVAGASGPATTTCCCRTAGACASPPTDRAGSRPNRRRGRGRLRQRARGADRLQQPVVDPRHCIGCGSASTSARCSPPGHPGDGRERVAGAAPPHDAVRYDPAILASEFEEWPPARSAGERVRGVKGQGENRPRFLHSTP